MLNGARHIVCGAVIWALLLTGAAGQSDDEGPSTSAGINLGFFIPKGDWNKHPYAEGVEQFRKSMTGSVEMEFMIFHWLGLGGHVGYTNLDMSRWEEYARAGGSEISAKAYMFNLGATLNGYLLSSKTANIKGELGFGLFEPEGEETNKIIDSLGGIHDTLDLSYKYDFLKTKFGYIFGLEFNQFFTDNIGLAFKICYLVVPAAIQYKDNTDYTLTALPITFGVRFKL
jgi:hypothetical protein